MILGSVSSKAGAPVHKPDRERRSCPVAESAPAGELVAKGMAPSIPGSVRAAADAIT